MKRFSKPRISKAVRIGVLVLFAAIIHPAKAQNTTNNLSPIVQTLDGGRTLKVVRCYPNGLMRAYCVSFDDGTLGSDWPVMDALRRRNIPATFFINSLHPQSKDAVAFPTRYEGFEIASHGANHIGLGKMELSLARKEIEQDQQILGEKFAIKVDGFAYPYGDIPKDEAKLLQLEQTMAELGIIYARGTATTNAFVPPENFIRWNPDCGFMTRLDKFLALPADDSVRVMMSFSHSIDFARGRMSFLQWEQQLDQLAADKSIWKLTMRDFARYIDALRALKTTDIGLSNESQMAVWVRVNGKAIEIPSQSTLNWKQIR